MKQKNTISHTNDSNESNQHSLRVGCVPYLNALPLLEGLQQKLTHPILLAPPQQLHQAMLQSQLDVALLPVLSYLEDPQLKIIPNSGIIAKGEVLSVKAFPKNPTYHLHNAEHIYLDPNSKTSQTLLKVLLSKKYDRDLQEINFVNHEQDAELILKIGDAALQDCHQPYSIDLGSEWYDLTGLPFVFACWICREDPNPQFLSDLKQAKENGLQKLESYAQAQQIVAPELALRYLSQHIRYDLNGPELVGLKLFLDWAQELERQDHDTQLRFVA